MTLGCPVSDMPPGIIFGTGTAGYAELGTVASLLDRSSGCMCDSFWAGGARLYPCGNVCPVAAGEP